MTAKPIGCGIGSARVSLLIEGNIDYRCKHGENREEASAYRQRLPTSISEYPKAPQLFRIVFFRGFRMPSGPPSESGRLLPFCLKTFVPARETPTHGGASQDRYHHNAAQNLRDHS
jgi:hypothetical protein